MTFKPAPKIIFRYSTLPVLLALACFAVPAAAQSAEEHARQMNDIAATPVYEDGPNNAGPPPPPYDPVQNRIIQMQGMAMIQMHGERELAKLKEDPRYQIYLHGAGNILTAERTSHLANIVRQCSGKKRAQSHCRVRATVTREP